MDAARFDALTRAMSVHLGRRRLLQGLAAGTFAGFLTRLGLEEAAAGCAGSAPCTGNADCANCSGTSCGPDSTCCRLVGATCKKGKQCCSRRCKRGKCRPCSSEQNTCLPTERFDAGSCTCRPCPDPLCSGVCCPVDKPSCCGTTLNTCKAALEGGTCQSDDDCCFSACREGRCCKPAGSPCGVQRVCCSQICDNGTCA